MAAYPDTATAHNRDLALQKYMLLYSQHESLREHLDQLRPLVTMTCSTAVTSPAHSPVRSPFYPSSSAGPISLASSQYAATPACPSASSSKPHRRVSMPEREAPSTYRRRGARLDTVDEAMLGEMVAEERKLFNVNECMKRTLTELLNCEDARNDRNFRMWVQCRLMETERELRTERRRRSSSGLDC